MEKIKKTGFELTKDEKGQLKGGFLLQTYDASTHLFADNYNCKSSGLGGLGDTNTNCNRCEGCDQHAPGGRDIANP